MIFFLYKLYHQHKEHKNGEYREHKLINFFLFLLYILSIIIFTYFGLTGGEPALFIINRLFTILFFIFVATTALLLFIGVISFIKNLKSRNFVQSKRIGKKLLLLVIYSLIIILSLGTMRVWGYSYSNRITFQRSFINDGQNVYYADHMTSKKPEYKLAVDSSTFEPIDCGYIKDKNGVYIVKVKNDPFLHGDTFDNRGPLYYVHKSWVEKINEADPKSFIIVKGEYNLCNFTKDYDSVFYDGNVIKFLNANNFQGIKRYLFFPTNFFKDSQAVIYELGRYSNKNIIEERFSDNQKFFHIEDNDSVTILQILKDADPSTFKILSNWHCKDKNAVFVKNNQGIIEKIEGSDPDSFKVLSGDRGKDKYHYYDGPNVVNEANTGTLKQIDEAYTKDNKSVFYGGDKIEGADPDSFKLIKSDHPLHLYSKDKNNVYYLGRLIEGADSDSFKTIRNGYSRDRDSLFYCCVDGNKKVVKLEGIDPNSYKHIYGYDWAGVMVDKNNAFFRNQDGKVTIIEGVDLPTFEELFGGYFKDRSSIYYHDTKIEQADPETFKIKFPFLKDDPYNAYDKNYRYKDGKIISKIKI